MSSTANVTRLVDFTMLADQLRLLPVSPAWGEVSKAIARLEDSVKVKSQPSPSDPESVKVFATRLRLNGEALGNALAAGLVLGEVSGRSGAGEKLVAGLAALARAYRFDGMNEKGVAATLAELKQTLTKDSPRIAEAWRVPALTDPDSVVQWEAALVAVRDTAEVPVTDIDGLVRRNSESAWTDWAVRLRSFFSGEPPLPPTAPELLNGASGRGPASVLRHGLERMTIAEWTQACQRALWPASPQDACPVWLARAAVHALGFRSLSSWSLFATGEFERPPKEVEAASAWDMLGANDMMRPSLLLVRQDGVSTLDGWLPGRSVSALSLKAAELDSLLETRKTGLDWFLTALGIQHLAVEMPVDERRLGGWQTAWSSDVPGSPARFAPVWIHVYGDPSIPRMPGHPVIAPRMVDDLRKELFPAGPPGSRPP